MNDLPRGYFGAILADPPWRFRTWSDTNQAKSPSRYYSLLTTEDIMALPVETLTATDAVLFIWISWPQLEDALKVIKSWGFQYKTCGFSWLKANVSQFDLFRDDADADMKLGYWTRANGEICLLATRGNPTRLAADVRQGIIEPGREHSRKPDCVHERIERLVAGPYLELFARKSRVGWTTWGAERTKFDPPASSQREAQHG